MVLVKDVLADAFVDLLHIFGEDLHHRDDESTVFLDEVPANLGEAGAEA